MSLIDIRTIEGGARELRKYDNKDQAGNVDPEKIEALAQMYECICGTREDVFVGLHATSGTDQRAVGLAYWQYNPGASAGQIFAGLHRFISILRTHVAAETTEERLRESTGTRTLVVVFGTCLVSNMRRQAHDARPVHAAD